MRAIDPRQWDDCVNWTSAPVNRYQHVRRNGKRWTMHRWVWVQTNGPIPEGMYVCHRCDNKRCVNIAHLYLATHRENLVDASRNGLLVWPRWRPRNTHCPRGHEYAGENLALQSNGASRCRECAKQHYKTYRQRKKARNAG